MDEDIKKLLEKNLELTEDIHEMTKKIKSYILWQKVFSIIKILIILVPIILGIIYLPPLLRDVFDQYRELLNIGGTGLDLQGLLGGQSADVDIQQIQKILR